MLQTPLINFHRDSGAKLVEFAGWEMPVYYEGLVKEHHYTRQHATFFDVSHMGRIEFRGNGAADLLEKLNTRRIGDMSVGQCRSTKQAMSTAVAWLRVAPTRPSS